MNVREINPSTTATLAQYVGAAVGLTLFTCWLVVAFQKDSLFFPPHSGVLRRTLWPLFYMNGVLSTEIKTWLKPTNHRCLPDTRPYQASEEGLKPRSVELHA